MISLIKCGFCIARKLFKTFLHLVTTFLVTVAIILLVMVISGK